MTPVQPSSHELDRRIDRLTAIVSLVDDRVGVCEDDLDCDIAGSLAESLADLATEIFNMRARLDEFTAGVAA